MPPGSYLVLSHGAFDFVPPARAAEFIEMSRPSAPAEFHTRTKEQICPAFAGLELMLPGMVPLAEWRAENEPQPRPSPADITLYTAVARIR